jgi:hypothetical protein
MPFPIITFRSFVDALEAIAVTGVTRNETRGPPASLTDAQLPVLWVQFPRGTEGPLVFGEHGGQQTMSCDVVIAVVPTVQNVQGANFDNTIDLMDNLMAGLRAIGACTLNSRWSANIRQTIVTVAGIDYWAIVCTVEG